MTAAWKPRPGGFLESDPRLVDNYLVVCAAFGETPGDVPEEIALIGTERPPDAVFQQFERLHEVDAGGDK